MSSIMEWAKREVELACKDMNVDGDMYAVMCYTSALEALEVLAGQGHSGISIGFTKQILNRLIDWKPLTPIEGTEDEWDEKFSGYDDTMRYQNKRYSALFKKVDKDGNVTYSDVDRVICVDIDKPDVSWYNCFITDIIYKMYPITMPYIPSDKPIKVYIRELLTDAKNGDYDSMAILGLEKDGKEYNVCKYFKESDKGFVEIDISEWFEREMMHKARLAAEKEKADE